MALCLFTATKTTAQCSCSNGDPIDSLKQTVNLVGILPFSQVVPFNKFSPATGTLSCVVTRTKVFTVVNIEIVNRDSTDRVTYQYNYTRTTSLSGPGISVSASSPRIYGPFELGQAGVDPDTIATFGPDTMFNNIVMRRQTTSAVGSYVGAGTVNFTYNNSAISGFVIGNSNNQTTIADYSDVTIELVYYFCPLQILAGQLRDFSVNRTVDGIALSWANDAEEAGYIYELERSSNGKDFRSFSQMKGRGRGAQQYSVTDKPDAGQARVYYRLKLTDAAGRSAYSAVKTVLMEGGGMATPTIYPNPVTNRINMQFPGPQSGTLTAELIGMNGQVLQARQVRANRLMNMDLTLDRKYPGGTYMVRVRNAETGSQSLSRIFIQ
jgi:hypothetical protein